MSARVLYRRVAGRGHVFPWLKKDSLRAKRLHGVRGETEAEAGEREGTETETQPLEAALPSSYRLHYSPAVYYRAEAEGQVPEVRAEGDEGKQRLVALARPFRRQTNHYSVSSSRRLSSTKNKLLDLAFNGSFERRTPSPPLYRREHQTPDLKLDPRAFQRCRTEYGSMTLDLSRRATPIQSKQAFLLLHKASVLKGRMKASDVTQFLSELGSLYQEQTPLVRSDTRFIMLLRYSVENLRQFTNAELLQVLQAFVRLGLPSTHSMLGLYENELIERASHMSLHELLLAADLWRCLGKQVPQFLKHLYNSVNLYLGQLGIPELVQLLYVMGEGRRCPNHLIQPIEQILMRHLDKLHPEEIGAVSLGLFKSQTSLSEGAVNCIVDKANAVIEEMSDFAMVNVFKLLRFSHLDHRAWLDIMAQEVPRRAPRMDVQGLMHVTLACSALHYRNDSILLSVAERLPSVTQHCRSKDSSKLLWSFGTLGVLPSQCPDLYPNLVEALRQRKAEFQRYPEHLLTGLLGLAFVSQFPEDLLALALSPQFVSQAVRNTQLELKKDFFTLDSTVALELPHWTGPRLASELGEEVAALLWKYAQSDICQKPEVLEAERLLQDLLGGEQFVCKRMILPHTRSVDLEVHLDSTGTPVPVDSSHEATSITEKSISTSPSHTGWQKIEITLTEDLLSQLVNSKKTTDPLALSTTSRLPVLHRVEQDEGDRLFNVGVDLSGDLIGSITKPSSPVCTARDFHKATIKLAIQVSNRNHYCYQSQQLLGLHALKRRQLQLAGYRVVELNHWEWFPLLKKSHAEKLAYLHCKVYSSLDYS